MSKYNIFKKDLLHEDSCFGPLTRRERMVFSWKMLSIKPFIFDSERTPLDFAMPPMLLSNKQHLH